MAGLTFLFSASWQSWGSWVAADLSASSCKSSSVPAEFTTQPIVSLHGLETRLEVKLGPTASRRSAFRICLTLSLSLSRSLSHSLAQPTLSPTRSNLPCAETSSTETHLCLLSHSHALSSQLERVFDEVSSLISDSLSPLRAPAVHRQPLLLLPLISNQRTDGFAEQTPPRFPSPFRPLD